jgi:hypothetical protein
MSLVPEPYWQFWSREIDAVQRAEQARQDVEDQARARRLYQKVTQITGRRNKRPVRWKGSRRR